MSTRMVNNTQNIRKVHISLPGGLEAELNERGKITLCARGMWYTLQGIIEELLLAWIRHYGPQEADKLAEEVHHATQ